MKKYITWTIEEDNKLIELKKSGVKREEISKIMLKPEHQIKIRIKELNLQRVGSKWTEDLDIILIKYRKEGLSLKEISDYIGFSISSVSSRCSLLNLEKRTNFDDRDSKKWKESELEIMKTMKKNGKNHYEIAKALNRSQASIRTKCSKEKIISPHINKWNKEEESILRKLIQEEKCAYDIMSILGRSFSSIEQKIKDLKLNKPGKFDSFEKVIDNLKLDYVIIHRLRNVRRNAKTRNIYYNLNDNIIRNLYNKQNGLCYYCGIKMDLTGKKTGMSIDRLNPKKGYTEDNIVLCMWAINTMKMRLQKEEFINFCHIISKRFTNNLSIDSESHLLNTLSKQDSNLFLS